MAEYLRIGITLVVVMKCVTIQDQCCILGDEKALVNEVLG